MVEKMVVFGAGLMGAGIAQVSAQGGFQVVMVDVSTEFLDKGMSIIRRNLEKRIEQGKLAAEEMKKVLARIRMETAPEQAAKSCDFVIEAVPERIDLKIELFQKLDNICRPGVIFATNTSALSISKMAEATSRPGEFIGMHFFNPVPAMRLVEIVRGEKTNDLTTNVATDIARRMGKEVVIVKESPGFVTTRMNALIGNEAFQMLEEKIASAEDIDKALKLGLNHPMGPFELVDLVGLDTRLNVLRFLHERLGEKYRPSPLLEQYVKEGRLGRKSGGGVYDYTEKK
jgi:3-hydroxybutyryl-CoA dehydrogenase